jgi:hypothetical protein
VLIHPTARRCAAILALTLSFAACKGEEKKAEGMPPATTPPVAAVAPFRVTALELGNAIDASKNVPAPTQVFAAGDTIYAVVASEGASPSTTLAAKWTYEDGQIVNEETITIAPTGPSVTEFHIAKPDGWPVGKYKVEITANNAPVLSRDFEVR